MKITLKKSSYKGSDGSSLSSARCKQFITLYDFCQQLGDTKITYQKLQEEACKNMLYGKTQADKAIRTFAPLLSKLEFINYEGVFPANSLFTENGKLFIQTIRSLELAEQTTNNTRLIQNLIFAKRDIQRIGLYQMYKNPEWKRHNIWIAIAMLQSVGDIYWENFGYMVYLVKEQKLSINEAIVQLEKENDQNTVFEYLNEEGKKLPNTFYSYIHAFLEECGILRDTDANGYSVICDEAEEFLDLIKIDCDGEY